MTRITGEEGEQMPAIMAQPLARAFPGMMVFGHRALARLPEGERIAVLEDDADGGLLSGTALNQATLAMRWPGVRDPLTATHPVTEVLAARLAGLGETVPDPDQAVVDRLAAIDGFDRAGRIVTIHGVPVPAGAPQTALFVVLRWRPLFSPVADPTRIYAGDTTYDAAHVTDEMQSAILLVSTAVYRDQLIKLQFSAPELFAAIWMRRFDDAERLTNTLDDTRLPQPYPRSRLGRRECLMLSASLMSEHERGFDILEALKFEGGVTKASIKQALKACSSMTGVYATNDATYRHLAGSVAHVRVLHPTMNAQAARNRGDVIFEAARSGIGQATLHATQAQRVTPVAGDKPARFFLGVEPVKLLPVHLIQMQDNMVRHEGEFWLRDRGAGATITGEHLGGKVMKLAIIATAPICPHTAAAMLGNVDDDPTTDLWKHQFIRPLTSNPEMEFYLAESARAAEDEGLFDPSETKVPFVPYTDDDRSVFKSSYEQARRRAETCSAPIDKAGWTQGFRFDAWRQPDAEVAFLRQCSEYIRYDPELDPVNRAPTQQVQGSRRKGAKAKKTVDLPTQHLLERIQDFFRPQFDRLQIPRLTRDHEDRAESRLLESLLHEIALMLPALSPITDDPNHFERIWADVDAPAVRNRVVNDWNGGQS